MVLGDITNTASQGARPAKRFGKFGGRARAGPVTLRGSTVAAAGARVLSPVKTELLDALEERERQEKQAVATAPAAVAAAPQRRGALQSRLVQNHSADGGATTGIAPGSTTTAVANAKKSRGRKQQAQHEREKRKRAAAKAKAAAALAKPLESPSKFRGRRRLRQILAIARQEYKPKPVGILSKSAMDAFWEEHGEQLGGDLAWLGAGRTVATPSSAATSSSSSTTTSSSSHPATPAAGAAAASGAAADAHCVSPRRELFCDPDPPVQLRRPARPPPTLRSVPPVHAPPPRVP